MPWKNKEDGTSEYVLSNYTTEELPTWSEMYNGFKNIDSYDDKPYGETTYKKYIISVVCNQLNKMIFEDGYDIPVMKYLKEHVSENIIDCRFIAEDIDLDNLSLNDIISKYSISEKIPFIYAYNKDDIFVAASKAQRIYITSEGINITSVKMIMKISNGESYKLQVLKEGNCDYEHIMDILFECYKSYFGDSIGWKDKNGNVIWTTPNNRCTSGYDPAL